MSGALSVLNEGPELLEGPQLFHHLVDWDKHGEACALDFLSSDNTRHSYTYRQLRQCVLALASCINERLRRNPLTTNQRPIIPLFIPQSPALYIAILAVLETGSTYCPINLDSPADRIQFIIQDVSATLFLTTETLQGKMPWVDNIDVLIIDEIPDKEQAASPQAADCTRQASPQELAYIMYTSGSTGKPKGVKLSHLAVTQSLLAHDRHIPSFERFLQFAAPSFDVSQFETFFPLFRGATLVSCDRPTLLNDLAGAINELDVDACELTPTVAGSLLQRREHVPKLRTLLTIGEMLTRPVVEEFGASDSRESMLYGMYGPTEAAIHCTVNAKMLGDAKVTNIGIPFDNVTTFVLAIDEPSDDQYKTEPKILRIREVGELVLAGPLLASGYLNRPEQTSTAFITVNDRPAYRTGDKARMLEDGTIDILGRISAGQVKIRGQRAELGEIEEAVYKHSNIKMAVASVLEGALIIFALQRQQADDVQAVQDTCAKWLPKYMVPDEVVLLDEFPYLPSGKVDKKRLEADFHSQRNLSAESEEANQTVLEHKVRVILREGMGIKARLSERLASHGIDSLLAIRAAGLLKSAGFQLSPLQVLQAETLRDLAQSCERCQSSTDDDFGPSYDFAELSDIASKALPAKDVVNAGQVLPCTAVQDAMLFETQINPAAYMNEVVLRLSPNITKDAAENAILKLAEHNAILRTGFFLCKNDHSSFVQIIWRSLKSENEGLYLSTSDLLHPFVYKIESDAEAVIIKLRLHHAQYDGWSLELLMDDLETILGHKELFRRPAFDLVVRAAIAAPGDSNTWENNGYWKDHLAQLDLTPMPNYHTTRTNAKKLAILHHQTAIKSSALESQAQNLGVSPQSIFQAAYSILLSAYLGTKDVVFGTVFSGRTSNIDGIESIIGPCLSTLPVRVDLESASNTGELVQNIHHINRQHLHHSSLSLTDIKKAGGIDPGRSLFDSLLIWQQTLHAADSQREHVTILDSTDYLEFSLTIEITPGRKNIELKANYETSVFPKRQVQALLQQLEQITTGLLRGDSDLTAALSFVGNECLSIDNPEPQVAVATESMSSIIENIAVTDPERPAVGFAWSIEAEEAKVETLSYKALNSQANQVAHLLVAVGTQPDDLICICMEKSPTLYSSILGIIKAGSGYLPVTPDTPIDRILYIISEAKVKIILTDKSMASAFANVEDLRVVNVEEIDRTILSETNPCISAGNDQLAYCVFTSGSTGTPKGVLVTRGNTLSNLEVLSELYPHTTSSRLLQSCSQAFDVSVFEIFFAWHVGACLCSASKDVLFRDIELAIRALGITHLSLTPTVAALIDPSKVPNVEFLVTAGEAVTQKVFNTWAGKGFYQGYGPSETTNICTVNPTVTKDHFINGIGQGFKNTSTFVLSAGEEFQVVPLGAEGEFCFGGAQVGRGYLNPEQSVGKFIEHPQYGKLYRSGDFGRMLPDGSLSFTGRKDDQVKVRGLRIELSEINKTILSFDESVDCITLVIEVKGVQSLITFWVPRNCSIAKFELLKPFYYSETIQKLFEALMSALPAYMVPSALLPVSLLPPTAQGKVDKRLLVETFQNLDVQHLNQASQSRESSADHSWTNIENNIADKVAEVTKVERQHISPDTSFFSLGIDSIMAISLVRALGVAGIKVAISDILRHSSVVRLAKATSKASDIAPNQSFLLPAKDTVLLQQAGFDEGFKSKVHKEFSGTDCEIVSVSPCTPLQEAMLSAGASTHGAYSNHTLIDLKVPAEKFKEAWLKMVARHEILRTCFVQSSLKNFAYAQVVLATFEVEDLFLETDDIAETIAQLQSKPLEVLHQKPPYRVVVVQSGKQQILSMSMHHSLYDGFAVSILFEEIEMALKGEELPPVVSFAPFLEHMASRNLEEDDKYWAKRFDGFRPVLLPARDSAATSSGFKNSRKTSSLKLSSIESQTKSHDVPILAVFQAIWTSILSQKLRTTDICFGNIVSGRTVPVEGVDRLVAPCFNTLPVRIGNFSNSTFLETFRALQAQNIENIPYQLTPLRRIQKLCGDGDAFFQTLVILQPPAKELDSSIWSIEEDNGVMDLPLVIEILPHTSHNTLEFILHYSSVYYSEEEAATLLEEIDEILVRALENPRRQVLSHEVKVVIQEASEKRRAKGKATEDKDEKSHRTLNDDELAILDLFAQYSSIPKEKIYANTTIHRLGLDSINAVQVASALRKQGYKCMANDVIQCPTIEKLAARLIAPAPSAQHSQAAFDFRAFDDRHRSSLCRKLQVNDSQVEAVRPCSGVQSGMLAQSVHSDGNEYINSFVMQIDAGIDVMRLRAAWETLVVRQEMLRTVFVGTDDSKYSFAMVTFTTDSKLLPWYESCETNTSIGHLKESINESKLIGGQWPWRLEVSTTDLGISLKFIGHHALYDAQSLETLLSEVAIELDEPSEIPAEATSIEPILGALLDAASSIHTTEDDNFWKADYKVSVNKFPDLSPLHESSLGSYVTTSTMDLTLGKLESLCQQSEVSIQAAGQATWARLLSMYTGEPATTFGVTLSGRSIHENAANVAFPTIVTLPITLNAAVTNRDLLTHSMEYSMRVQALQFTPLTTIQKLSDHPEGKLFDTLFAYQKTASSTNDIHRPWKLIDETASADYIVSLELEPLSDETLQLRLTARTRVVPREQAKLILDQFEVLLEDLLTKPQSLGSSAKSIKAPSLLSVTAAIEPTLPSEITLLHTFVERQAKLTPDTIALEYVENLSPFISKTWTYAELDRQGNRVANLIQSHGIKQGEIIGICFNKCAEASFAMLGILKSGCSYVALDPNAPADRMRFILEDSKGGLVFSNGQPVESLANAGFDNAVKVIDMGQEDCLNDFGADNVHLERPIDPQETSYCLYTSGTTGTPKGCLLSHENAVQAMLSFQKLFAGSWTEVSKWLTVASWHFDVSVLEQYWSWSVGIRVVCAPRDLIFEDIPGTINQLAITHIDLTPSLARLVQPEDVPSLWNGVFITGGEQLKQEILDVWGEKGCIYNGYGPTEATIGCTMYTRVPPNGKPANIGKAFLNVGSYVLRPETNEPVLRGAVGELCVSGKLVGKGYLNREELSAERFPYVKEFGERMYRTGDLVRIMHDNTFLFLGRADDQVKLRGQRIQLSEGTEVMKKYVGGLDEVVTLVLRHAKQQKEQLVTFFTQKASSESSFNLISLMREACKAHLPPYMVPTHFIPLNSLPLSANSKADSKQLAKIYNETSIDDLQKLNAESQLSREWTEEECKSLKVLADAIGIDAEAVTSGTTIFELGVDSISVIGLCRKLQEAGYANAQLSVVMQNTSVDKLINVLTSKKRAGTSNKSAVAAAKQLITAFSHKHKTAVAYDLNINGDEIESMAPCTAAQEGMIYRFLDSQQDLYYNTFDFDLSRNTKLENLIRAWETVMNVVQVLRTSFVLTDDGCAQVVVKKRMLPFNVAEICLSSTPGLIEAGRKSSEKRGGGKDRILTNPWALQFVKGSDRSIMTLSIFHPLYDGMSLPQLLSKVQDEYISGTLDYGPDFFSILPQGPLAQVGGADEFWKSKLANAQYHALPRIGEDGSQDVCATRNIGPKPDLESLRQQFGVTHQAILLAAWSSTIQRHISSNVSFGLVLSGRSIDFEGAEAVIGPLLNTVVFNTTIQRDMNWKALVKDCQDYSTAVLPYQHSALKDVQKWCGARAGQAFFDTLFVFQQEEQQEADAIWRSISTKPVADYPLAFESQLNRDGGLTLTIVAQGNFVSANMAEALLNEVESALSNMSDSKGIVPLTGTHLLTNGSDAREVSPSNSAESDESFVWTQEATSIREELQTLAQTEDISERVPLFELGLDSIDVIKLSSRLKRQGIQLSVSTIIQSQTIANMVGQIQSTTSIPKKPVVSIKEWEDKITKFLKAESKLPADAVSVLPATPLQEGMVAEMIASEYLRYFNHQVYRVDTTTDINRLKEAWEAVVRQHEILRTTFAEIDTPDLPMSYVQIVQDTPLLWEETDSNDEYLEQAIKIETKRAISEARNGRLFRLRQLNCPTAKYIMLSISHALYDGSSLQSLHQDVARAYNELNITRPDFRNTLEQVLNQDGPSAINFWKTTLSGLPQTTFPRRNRPSSQVHRWEQASQQNLSDIREFCRKNAISVQTLGQTCWALVLASYLERLDVVFGCVLSCRDTEEANEIMFPLMNTVAVRSVLHGSIIDMLRYMQANGNSTRPFQHFPLRKAQALAGPRDGSLFDTLTLFIFQGSQSRNPSEESLLYQAHSGASDVEFPVCVEIELVDDRLIWRTACKDSARSLPETKRLINDLDKVMSTMMHDPRQTTILSKGKNISICGLPTFQDEFASEPSSDDESADDQPAPDDEEWAETELLLRKVLSQVSQVPEADIGKDQTIFHLGLDSISAIKVSSMLRRQDVKLGVQDIMRNNSIRKMAQHLCRDEVVSDSSRDENTALALALGDISVEGIASVAQLTPDDIQEILPVGAGQLYTLARWQLSGGTTFTAAFEYSVDCVVKFEIEKAWASLVHRHAILRTIFVSPPTKGGTFVQLVLKSKDVPILWTDTIDAEVTPQLPVFLSAQSAEKSTLLTIHIHHALYDAISLPLLVQDFEMLLSSTPVPELENNFSRFIAQSLDTDQSQEEKRKHFWQQYLDNIFPIVDSKASKQRIEIFQPGVAIGKLASAAQKKGLSVDVLLLAAFSEIYADFTRSAPEQTFADLPDSIFGIYLSNRGEFPSLTAPTLNLLPLRTTSGPIDNIGKKIQEELRAISDATIVGTNLQEIYEWTGVQVNCFVNIWKAVSTESEPESPAQNDGDGSIKYLVTNVSHEALMRTARTNIVDVTPDAAIASQASKETRAAYLPSIDFEFKLLQDGTLDMGVFAPIELMDVEQGEKFIGDLAKRLRRLSA